MTPNDLGEGIADSVGARRGLPLESPTSQRCRMCFTPEIILWRSGASLERT
jgi:hypothetical protein